MLFRSVIGLRHSWLSREIVVFGAFANAAILYAGLVIFRGRLPAWLVSQTSLVGWSVVASGLIGVFCSVMIYAVTRREFWRFDRTFNRFSLTTILLGTATFWVAVAWSGGDEGRAFPLSVVLAQVVVGVAVFKLLSEAVLYRYLLSPHVTTLGRSARLHVGPLALIVLGRNLLGVVGGVVLPWVAWTQSSSASPVLVTTSLTLLLIGELLERYLYFAAVASPRMPGAVRS